MKNEERFSSKADIYKKFRPTYPKELIDYLYAQTGFTKDSKIADIGSGTGIFSRLLLEKGSYVWCVEPNNEMRKMNCRNLKTLRLSMLRRKIQVCGKKALILSRQQQRFIGRKSMVVSSGAPEDCMDFFADNVYECKTFRNDLPIDRETYIGWNVSSSYSPDEEKCLKKYNSFISELGKLFDEYNVNGILTYPHFVSCYIGRA